MPADILTINLIDRKRCIDNIIAAPAVLVERSTVKFRPHHHVELTGEQDEICCFVITNNALKRESVSFPSSSLILCKL